MAQVRIAHANLMATKERLDIDTKVNGAYRRNLEKAEASGKISGELSQLELAHMRLATAETEIERYLSLGNYYVAYFRILNTLGIENLHAATVEELEKTLAAERERAAEELAQAKAEYEAEQAKATEEVVEEEVVVDETETEEVETLEAAPAEPAVETKKADEPKPEAAAVRPAMEYRSASINGNYDRLMGKVMD